MWFAFIVKLAELDVEELRIGEEEDEGLGEGEGLSIRIPQFISNALFSIAHL